MILESPRPNCLRFKAASFPKPLKVPVVKTRSLPTRSKSCIISAMFLRSTWRKKDGKEHAYFSIVEHKRVATGKVVPRHVLSLGEINSSQPAAWGKTIEIVAEGPVKSKTVALFPEDRAAAISSDEIVRIGLSDLPWRRPRPWGACWLATEWSEKLELDRFWAEKLPPSGKGTRWDWVWQTLVTDRLLDPGSAWKWPRPWFEATAMADLLGEDFALAEGHKLDECWDLLLPHQQALFKPLTGRWKDLCNAKFDGLLYDWTSTYCEQRSSLWPGGQAQVWLQSRPAPGWRPGGHCADRHPGGLSLCALQ